MNLEQQVLAALYQDDYEATIALCEHWLTLEPASISALVLLEIAWFLQEEELEANACNLLLLTKVEEADQPELLNDITQILLQVGNGFLENEKFYQAELFYRHILDWDNQHGEAFRKIGHCLLGQEKWEEAIASYQNAIAINPNDFVSHNNIGNTLAKLNKPKESLDYYLKALDLSPNNPDVLYNLRNLLYSMGDCQIIIDTYEAILAQNPQSMEWHEEELQILGSLGRAYHVQGNLAKAIFYYRKFLDLDPQDNNTLYHLGLALHTSKDPREAFSAYQKILDTSQFIFNLESHFDHPDLHQLITEALKSPAHELEIQARWNQSVSLLMLGDYELGFQGYEWRWVGTKTYPIAFSQPFWDGSDLSGKRILIYSEQGFGDIIQFIRYIPLVKQRNGQVIFSCFPSLINLFKTVSGIDEIIPQEPEALLACDFEVQIPLISLARIFSTSLNSVPDDIPYLQAPADSTIQLVSPKGSQLKIGIVWTGRPSHPDNHNRSIDLADFLHCLRVPGTAFYSLQKGDGEQALENLPLELMIQNLSPQIKDFANTAAAIAQLDLVITIDTSVAHLAGAMGKPVWILLHYVPDWRWMLEREDSPWYPTARLFRQTSPGDWEGVFQRVAAALQEWIDLFN